MTQTITALSFIGTRPEAIKLAPVLLRMASETHRFKSVICSTGQHDQMLRQAMAAFGLEPHYDLNVMRPSQSLAELTARLVVAIGDVIAKVEPSLVLVQGDTTTTFCGALAASYARIPV